MASTKDVARPLVEFRRCLQYLGTLGSDDFDHWVALLRTLNAVDLLVVEISQGSRLSLNHRDSLGLRAIHLYEAKVIPAEVKSCIMDLSLLRNISAHAQEFDRTNLPDLNPVLDRTKWLFAWYLTSWKGGQKLSAEEAGKLIDSLEPIREPKNITPRRIFLCYATEDSSRVAQIYTLLKARGHRPWMDKRDLLPGQSWEVEIRNAIQKADCFIAFMSLTSVSKRGYVQKEVRFALDVLGEIPAGEIYLIPVRLEPCSVPATLEFLHWIDLADEHSHEKLLAAIESERLETRSGVAEQTLAPGG